MFIAATLIIIPRADARDDDPASTVKSDETVILIPTVAHLPEGSETWEVSLHGWIFEQRWFSTTREWWSKLTADDDDLEEELDDDQLMELPPSAVTSAPAARPRLRKRDIFKQRSHYFLVDNERGKRIAIRLSGERFVTDPSAPNGHFFGVARIPGDQLDDRHPGQAPNDADGDRVLPVRVDLEEGDDRVFESDVYFLRDRGISVISDIDDTIKITEVLSKRACTRNTFLRPFRAVPGMVQLYADWAKQGATIHYVSACPWQLYEPLRVFMNEAGFPAGPVEMKLFRWKDRSGWDLFDSPESFKVETIGALLERFPNRRFILVGDSGQSDPEAYATLARRYPRQVRRILIRMVPGGRTDFADVFADLPREKWRVFKNPHEIRGSLAVLTAPSTSQPAR